MVFIPIADLSMCKHNLYTLEWVLNAKGPKPHYGRRHMEVFGVIYFILILKRQSKWLHLK